MADIKRKLLRAKKSDLRLLVSEQGLVPKSTKQQLINQLLHSASQTGSGNATVDNKCSACLLCDPIAIPPDLTKLTNIQLVALQADINRRLITKCLSCPECIKLCRDRNCPDIVTVTSRLEKLARNNMKLSVEMYKRGQITREYLMQVGEVFTGMLAEGKEIKIKSLMKEFVKV